MQQLTPRQAGHLYADTTHSNANLSLLHIYDQSTAPGGVVRFKQVLAHLAGRLDRAPLFRRRVQAVPLQLDLPYWVDDEHFDLEYHVRHIALPKPGDWRQFCIQASRIHARALDLQRPLWEAYVIEGLDSFLDLPVGSFALLLKTHLAAVDMDHAGELIRLLHDDAADPGDVAPPLPWLAATPPGAMALALRGGARSAATPWRLALPASRSASQWVPALRHLLAERLLPPDGVPVTRFNSVVSAHRVFDTRRFAAAEFAAIRRLVRGASLDDAVLAVVGGALRHYLQGHAELPQATLSVRLDDHAAARVVALGTDIADPHQRLRWLQRQRTAAARGARAPAAGLAPEVAQLAPEASHLPGWGIARKVIGRAACALGQLAPAAHARIAHLPGPSTPQFLCGARLSYASAILPIEDGLGLALAVTEQEGRVVISPTSCRELMPDPEVFAQALRDSFQELLALAVRKPPNVKLSVVPAARLKPSSASLPSSDKPRRKRRSA